MNLSFYEIARVVEAKNNVKDYPNFMLTGIEFDSRKIVEGSLFLPLKGVRDGHDFIEQAFDKGATATFSEKVVDVPHILVEDNLKAFQNLAAYYLKKIGAEVIAVTGSNGKTTTKDMIAHVLSTTYKTYKTQGNYNNEIGLPYTILHMPVDTEKIVLEMGQDHFGDIHLLSKIARPNISVVTLIGEAHLEFFGSRDKIAQGKMQIADGMPNGGILIAPSDKLVDLYLPDNQNIFRFGENEDIFISYLVEEKQQLTFEVNFIKGSITIPLSGKYNATNAMLAGFVARICGVKEKDIINSLANIELTKNRTEWKKASNGADILSDVYNANPTAMRLILETFSVIPKNKDGRKLVVLADMKELGDTELALHEQIADYLTNEIDEIFIYGPLMSALAEKLKSDTRLHYYASVSDFEKLKSDVLATLGSNDQILLKGSNSMKLEEVVNALVG